jgi:hypothetical protein
MVRGSALSDVDASLSRHLWMRGLGFSDIVMMVNACEEVHLLVSLNDSHLLLRDERMTVLFLTQG